MRVLIACEFSGILRTAFTKLGHDAISCDLLPTEIPGKHYQCDVREILNDQWDLIIGHPSCRTLTNSGVRWLSVDPQRWIDLDNDCAFFNLFLNHKCELLCVENPIPHKYAVERLERNYDQKIQPYQFGDPYKKATCLWLKNLPKLIPTNVLTEYTQKVWLEGPGPERSKNRSRTYPGIASAIAQQFTNYVGSR